MRTTEHPWLKIIQIKVYSLSFLDETDIRKYMWSRFRKGAVGTCQQAHRVDGIWHKRGRMKAIGWACRFFARMMGHTARRRYHDAQILFTKLNGATHRHANVLKIMLQEYFRTQVGGSWIAKRKTQTKLSHQFDRCHRSRTSLTTTRQISNLKI